MSRLLEEPEEQTQKSSESPRKSKKSRKISSNVYDFFCDQPSTSEQSQPKSPSKKKQTESKPSGSNIKAGQKTGKVAIGIVDLSKKHETTDKPTVELSTSAHSSLFDEQPYIENPEEPSTSTGFRTCKIDDELFARALRLTDFNDEKTEQDDTTMMYKPKLSSFLSIRKKPRLSKHSDQTDTAESSPRKDTRPKQTVIILLYRQSFDVHNDLVQQKSCISELNNTQSYLIVSCRVAS